MSDAMRAPWDRAAAVYADVFDGQVSQTIEPLLATANVTRGTRLLDVATGPGTLAGAGAERGAVAKGIDFSPKMVEVARKTFPNVEFRVADAAELPFEDGSFDAVVMGYALFMISEPAKALSEAQRVLVSGGKIACSVWDWPVPGFDLFYSRMAEYVPEEPMLSGDPPLLGVSDHDVLSAALTEAGFVDPRVEVLPLTWDMDNPDRLFDALASLRDFSSLSAVEVASFRSDVVAAAGEYKREDRYEIPFPTLVLSATKK